MKSRDEPKVVVIWESTEEELQKRFTEVGLDLLERSGKLQEILKS